MKTLTQYIDEALKLKRGDTIADTVDLGPNVSVLWCTHNVGAKSETGRGLYFSWGNVEGHEYDSGYRFGTRNYKKTFGSELTSSFKSGDPTYDCARKIQKGKWRIPTKEEFENLYDNTEKEWVTINKQNGYKFISKEDESKYIFIPVVGYYDGNTIENDNFEGDYLSSTFYGPHHAHIMNLYSYNVYPSSGTYRFYGQSVRAVQDK